ncbi:4-hydroxylaminobenzoate lyase [Pseudomonas botevensis]|uniref:4-hydroxylaminobenzoate lyase n=1 Tax=Pseudomonas botevensis TaxID=2842352 RepID=UPI001C3C4C6F|nr:DUF4863 family protein [Pseudomonas botevensis]MBV4476977.1 DUF4863 family protein [Pseudomonas botevensis]
MLNERETLIEKTVAFLATIKDRTPGPDMENWLNTHHGPGTLLYEDLARLIKSGVANGWAADQQISGPHYRRSRLMEPSEQNHFFSLTTVYIDPREGRRAPEHTFRGDYHLHPYGEFNLVVPLEPDAALMGPQGWCHAGWTAPAPGSHHYPEVRGGALIAFFFLPSGRISYDIQAPK